jgi:hypothetical protein
VSPWFFRGAVVVVVRMDARACALVFCRCYSCCCCRLVPWCHHHGARACALVLSLFVPADVVIVVVAVVEVVGKEEAKKVRRGCSATFQVNDFGGP